MSLHPNPMFLNSAVCYYEAFLPFLVTENLFGYLHLVKTKHSSMTAAYFLLACSPFIFHRNHSHFNTSTV